MSRTYRKDSLDTDKKPPCFVCCGGILVDCRPTAKEINKAHRDKKKRSKPGKRAKVYLNKGRKAKIKQNLIKATREDPDGVPMPVDPKHHIWDYN